MFLHAPASNMNGFLYRNACTIQHNWRGLEGPNWTYLTLENYDLQEGFPSVNQFSQEKMCWMLLTLTQMVSFNRYMWSFNLA
jgi:hypothetical protein